MVAANTNSQSGIDSEGQIPALDKLTQEQKEALKRDWDTIKTVAQDVINAGSAISKKQFQQQLKDAGLSGYDFDILQAAIEKLTAELPLRYDGDTITVETVDVSTVSMVDLFKQARALQKRVSKIKKSREGKEKLMQVPGATFTDASALHTDADSLRSKINADKNKSDESNLGVYTKLVKELEAKVIALEAEQANIVGSNKKSTARDTAKRDRQNAGSTDEEIAEQLVSALGINADTEGDHTTEQEKNADVVLTIGGEAFTIEEGSRITYPVGKKKQPLTGEVIDIKHFDNGKVKLIIKKDDDSTTYKFLHTLQGEADKNPGTVTFESAASVASTPDTSSDQAVETEKVKRLPWVKGSIKGVERVFFVGKSYDLQQKGDADILSGRLKIVNAYESKNGEQRVDYVFYPSDRSLKPIERNDVSIDVIIENINDLGDVEAGDSTTHTIDTSAGPITFELGKEMDFPVVYRKDNKKNKDVVEVPKFMGRIQILNMISPRPGTKEEMVIEFQYVHEGDKGYYRNSQKKNASWFAGILEKKVNNEAKAAKDKEPSRRVIERWRKKITRVIEQYDQVAAAGTLDQARVKNQMAPEDIEVIIEQLKDPAKQKQYTMDLAKNTDESRSYFGNVEKALKHALDTRNTDVDTIILPNGKTVTGEKAREHWQRRFDLLAASITAAVSADTVGVNEKIDTVPNATVRVQQVMDSTWRRNNLQHVEAIERWAQTRKKDIEAALTNDDSDVGEPKKRDTATADDIEVRKNDISSKIVELVKTYNALVKSGGDQFIENAHNNAEQLFETFEQLQTQAGRQQMVEDLLANKSTAVIELQILQESLSQAIEKQKNGTTAVDDGEADMSFRPPGRAVGTEDTYADSIDINVSDDTDASLFRLPGRALDTEDLAEERRNELKSLEDRTDQAAVNISTGFGNADTALSGAYRNLSGIETSTGLSPLVPPDRSDAYSPSFDPFAPDAFDTSAPAATTGDTDRWGDEFSADFFNGTPSDVEEAYRQTKENFVALEAELHAYESAGMVGKFAKRLFTPTRSRKKIREAYDQAKDAYIEARAEYVAESTEKYLSSRQALMTERLEALLGQKDYVADIGTSALSLYKRLGNFNLLNAFKYIGRIGGMERASGVEGKTNEQKDLSTYRGELATAIQWLVSSGDISNTDELIELKGVPVTVQEIIDNIDDFDAAELQYIELKLPKNIKEVEENKKTKKEKFAAWLKELPANILKGQSVRLWTVGLLAGGGAAVAGSAGVLPALFTKVLLRTTAIGVGSAAIGYEASLQKSRDRQTKEGLIRVQMRVKELYDLDKDSITIEQIEGVEQELYLNAIQRPGLSLDSEPWNSLRGQIQEIKDRVFEEFTPDVDQIKAQLEQEQKKYEERLQHIVAKEQVNRQKAFSAGVKAGSVAAILSVTYEAVFGKRGSDSNVTADTGTSLVIEDIDVDTETIEIPPSAVETPEGSGIGENIAVEAEPPSEPVAVNTETPPTAADDPVPSNTAAETEAVQGDTPPAADPIEAPDTPPAADPIEAPDTSPAADTTGTVNTADTEAPEVPQAPAGETEPELPGADLRALFEGKTVTVEGRLNTLSEVFDAFTDDLSAEDEQTMAAAIVATNPEGLAMPEPEYAPDGSIANAEYIIRQWQYNDAMQNIMVPVNNIPESMLQSAPVLEGLQAAGIDPNNIPEGTLVPINGWTESSDNYNIMLHGNETATMHIDAEGRPYIRLEMPTNDAGEPLGRIDVEEDFSMGDRGAQPTIDSNSIDTQPATESNLTEAQQTPLEGVSTDELGDSTETVVDPVSGDPRDLNNDGRVSRAERRITRGATDTSIEPGNPDIDGDGRVSRVEQRYVNNNPELFASDSVVDTETESASTDPRDLNNDGRVSRAERRVARGATDSTAESGSADINNGVADRTETVETVTPAEAVEETDTVPEPRTIEGSNGRSVQFSYDTDGNLAADIETNANTVSNRMMSGPLREGTTYTLDAEGNQIGENTRATVESALRDMYVYDEAMQALRETGEQGSPEYQALERAYRSQMEVAAEVRGMDVQEAYTNDVLRAHGYDVPEPEVSVDVADSLTLDEYITSRGGFSETELSAVQELNDRIRSGNADGTTRQLGARLTDARNNPGSEEDFERLIQSIVTVIGPSTK